MPTPTTAPPSAPAPTAQPPPQRGGGGAVLLGSVLIGAGAIWLLAALGVDVPVAVVTPVLLVVLGLAVLVSAVRGRDHVAIGVAIVVGIWVAIAAVVTSVIDLPLSGAVGERERAPVTVAEAEAPQRLFAGRQVIDLRDLEVGSGIVDVEVSTVLGEVEVLVPAGTAVRIDASVAAGSIQLFDETNDGVGVRRTFEDDDWEQATRRVDLELRVGFGEIRVRSG